jgi:hypothetical protein
MLEEAANPERLGAQLDSSAFSLRGGRTCCSIPHVHCIVPAGGFSSDYKAWVHPKYAFFLPVAVLGTVFRAKFAEGLRRAHRRAELRFCASTNNLRAPKRFDAFMNSLFNKDWIVYAKPAFGGPSQVLQYIGRYTHRVAISNHRLQSSRVTR